MVRRHLANIFRRLQIKSNRPRKGLEALDSYLQTKNITINPKDDSEVYDY